MEEQLAKLSPEQRQMIMAKAQQEANQQVMQQMMEMMNKACFNKCVGTSVSNLYCIGVFVFWKSGALNSQFVSLALQGDRLDSKEQACLASCQDRYFDCRAAVQDAIQKRQNTGM